MAESFSGNLKVSLSGTFSSDNDLSTVQQAYTYSKAFPLVNGTAANQANQLFMDQRTITASSSENLDLYGGLTNAFGTTINFASIKGIIIYAASSNTNNVIVGGDATSGFANWISDTSDEIVVKPGGLFALVDPGADGYAVTDSTADILKITNSSSGTSVTYDVILIGEV